MLRVFGYLVAVIWLTVGVVRIIQLHPDNDIVMHELFNELVVTFAAFFVPAAVLILACFWAGEHAKERQRLREQRKRRELL